MRNKEIRKILSIKNIFLILLATNIVALGVALLLRARLGTDPLTVLQDGFHVRLHITGGEAALLYNAVVLSSAFYFVRSFNHFSNLSLLHRLRECWKSNGALLTMH